MRLRKKWWARPELEESNLFIPKASNHKGKWNEVFGNNNPVYLELGCGRGGFLLQHASNNPDINYLAVDLKDEVLIYGLHKLQENNLENARLTAMNIDFIEEVFEKDEVSKIYIN
ncbi:MAG: tRNA (guanosine(46)-N7)-methyltransferase TrmB, partial [Clostridium sp.]